MIRTRADGEEVGVGVWRFSEAMVGEVGRRVSTGLRRGAVRYGSVDGQLVGFGLDLAVGAIGAVVVECGGGRAGRWLGGCAGAPVRMRRTGSGLIWLPRASLGGCGMRYLPLPNITSRRSIRSCDVMDGRPCSQSSSVLRTSQDSRHLYWWSHLQQPSAPISSGTLNSRSVPSGLSSQSQRHYATNPVTIH